MLWFLHSKLTKTKNLQSNHYPQRNIQKAKLLVSVNNENRAKPIVNQNINQY